uniref:Uncharacterized protein n=1 Tax=Cyprinus carpio TaxID=7962 RepID=A0A8C2FAV2_CYPCA
MRWINHLLLGDRNLKREDVSCKSSQAGRWRSSTIAGGGGVERQTSSRLRFICKHRDLAFRTHAGQKTISDLTLDWRLSSSALLLWKSGPGSGGHGVQEPAWI